MRWPLGKVVPGSVLEGVLGGRERQRPQTLQKDAFSTYFLSLSAESPP